MVERGGNPKGRAFAALGYSASAVLESLSPLTGEKLVVAVSGGPDSVCLLHLLSRLRGRFGYELHVAHLNHMLRGQASDEDATYVREFAGSLGLPVSVRLRDVRSLRETHHTSLEEEARRQRYLFFAEVANESGAKAVAVGHTSDDQVETLLLHLVRGTGVVGLRGMQAVSRWRSSESGLETTIVRPLLSVRREQTHSYCEVHDLRPRIDASNWSPRYLRNRVRNELLPLLASYNPRVCEALLRTGVIAGDDLAYLQEEAQRAFGRMVEEVPHGLRLDLRPLRSCHHALQRYIMREVLRRLLGDVADIEWAHLQSMMAALYKPAGTELSLPGDLQLRIGYDSCIVVKGVDAYSPFPPIEGEHPVPTPGRANFDAWHAVASVLPASVAIEDAGRWVAFLDLDRTGERLVARRRRNGDRFQPLGMSAPKKLQDFFVDAKIPRAWRDGIPIIATPKDIVWLAGWRIDDRFKVTPDTTRMLRLELHPPRLA